MIAQSIGIENGDEERKQEKPTANDRPKESISDPLGI